ncbi:MAG: response regulator [Luteolibacter sp.]
MVEIVAVAQEIVYVVDDDEGMRKALSRLLRLEGYEVRPFASAAAFIEGYRGGDAACVLLDVSMPDTTGLELQKQLTRAGIHISIVFLTGEGDIAMSVQAIKSGAVDFLTKPVDDTRLLQTVRSALDHATSRREERAVVEALVRRHATLTPREKEVMEHVVAGALNKQIAATLGTGEQNIKIHRGRVMEKMGVESLPDLVRAAEKLGLARQGG